jgi:hypothetical protein
LSAAIDEGYDSEAASNAQMTQDLAHFLESRPLTKCQSPIPRVFPKPSATSWAPRRLCTLDGATVGLLDNSKLNAAPLLAAIGDLLTRYAIKSTVVRTKGHGFSYPVEEPIAEETEQITEGMQAVKTFSTAGSG